MCAAINQVDEIEESSNLTTPEGVDVVFMHDTDHDGIASHFIKF